jgi:enoyl-CoA hydratase/carnithine racemase
VTLNRPDRYNALGSRIVDELVEAVESIEVRLIHSLLLIPRAKRPRSAGPHARDQYAKAAT